jgi:KaiC/GvpD/RAD55 family RecA-like ATPase
MLTDLEKRVGTRYGQLVNDTNNNGRRTVSHIPSELLEFVRRDTYSLLVKGYAGAGKTTLSLTILRTLKIKSNFFYISTRLSPKQLFIYYPWLGKYVDISTNQDENPTTSSQRMGYNLSSFEDARLDEPESLFERITNQLMDVKAPIIIIDSWDAVASFMDKEARLNNERVLQTWRERAGAKLIFISENPSDTTLDFLVDGIVELDQKVHYGMRLREISLRKLRGIRINKSSYIYTLNKSVFQSYNPYDPSDFTFSDSYNNNKINPTRSLKKGSTRLIRSQRRDRYISSGYEELDEQLGGGFPRKGTVLLETHSSINSKVLLTLLAGIFSNVLRNDNPILIEPFMGIDEKTIMSYIRPYLPPEEKKDLIRFSDTDTNKDLPSKYTISQFQNLSNSQKQIHCFRDMMAKARREYQNKILVNVMGIGMCSTIHQYRKDQGINFMTFISANADLTLMVLGQPYATDLNLTEMADVQLRLSRVSGTLVLRSVTPETVPFAIVADRTSGYPTIRLESLV